MGIPELISVEGDRFVRVVATSIFSEASSFCGVQTAVFEGRCAQTKAFSVVIS